MTVENQSEVWHNIYGGKKKFKIKNFTFNIGDWVRISFLKELFDREYSERWSRKYCKVVKSSQRMQGKPLFSLEDYAGDPVEGIFYKEELLPVTVGANDIYQTEKVISSRKRRGQPKEYLVKWLGWRPKFNSYISETELKNIRGEV